MLTPFGKELRKMRIERTMPLKNMAEQLGISSAYLSSIEYGKRQVTDQLFDAIINILQPTAAEIDVLTRARKMSVESITVNLGNASNTAKETMLAFARRFTELSPDEYEQIQRILSAKETK